MILRPRKNQPAADRPYTIEDGRTYLLVDHLLGQPKNDLSIIKNTKNQNLINSIIEEIKGGEHA